MPSSVNQQTPTVVVVGSLHYDIMIDAPHQPQTGETLAGSRWYPKFGGKGGNQAVAASRAGCTTHMVSAVGDDDFGTYLLRQLASANVSVEYVQAVRGTGSGMSVAINDRSGDYAAVIVSGANLKIDPVALESETLWEQAAVLLLQNEVAESLNLSAALRARQSDVLICCNAAPARHLSAQLAELVDILIVNEIEAAYLCDQPVDSTESAQAAAVTLARRYPTVVVTAGAKGLAVATKKGDVFYLPAREVELVSTHGAGDVFTGTLCAALAGGDSLSDAAARANEAAAVHVSRQVSVN